MARAAKTSFMLLLFALLGSFALAQTRSVADSVHNLSIGSGPTATSGGCVFCHAPHNTSGLQPLWNHQMPAASTEYAPYTSSTYKQANAPITTRSKLCLSCHDGTVALGQTAANGLLDTSTTLSSASNLGINLAKDHPLGFTMPAVDDGEIKLSLTTAPVATANSAVQLYDNKIECITCHDPHAPNRDSLANKFLVLDNANGALCSACHDSSRGSLAGWLNSTHGATASNSVSSAVSPYGTVAMSACRNCHTSHNAAGTGPRLLRGSEEAACITCHSSAVAVTPAAPNVMDVITKSAFSHPTTRVTDVHDPAEALPTTNARHAECADCHNPHAAQRTTGTALRPLLQESLTGAIGVDASTGTTVLKPALNEYEICFKCHADSNNKPQNATFTDFGRTPYRQTFSTALDPYNVRMDLASDVARHNVTMASGTRGAVAPSLRSKMLIAGAESGPSLANGTFIYCTDCHSSDTGKANGGLGPNGAHGSSYEHLVERRYEMNKPVGAAGGDITLFPYASGQNGPFALCDKCHDLDGKIMTGDTVFGKHALHLTKGVSCSSCHASHGIQSGSIGRNAHLINLDLAIAGAVNRSDGTTIQPYINTSAKTCYVTCHGKTHDGEPY